MRLANSFLSLLARYSSAHAPPEIMVLGHGQLDATGELWVNFDLRKKWEIGGTGGKTIMTSARRRDRARRC